MKTIVIGSNLSRYPSGGGLFWVPLQYVLGFRKFKFKVFWLEILPSTNNNSKDIELIDIFQKRMTDFGLQNNYVLLYFHEYVSQSRGYYVKDYEKIEFFGKSKEEFENICKTTDVLLNLWYAIRPPILDKFDFKVLLDTDPGLLQISALSPELDLGIGRHDRYLTIGENVGKEWCSIPTLGINWLPFRQPVNLDVWISKINIGSKRFSTVTQWEWDSIRYNGELVDNSKRSQFLKYIKLPNLTKQGLELAVNIHPRELAPQSLKADYDLLVKNGWNLVDPRKVTSDPISYQNYIAQSRAEFSVAKKIYVQLKTGWFSDRSICYLASGKPVLVQDTEIEDNLPTGEGLLTFRNLKDILQGIKKINKDYMFHCRSARKIAEKYFDSNKILKQMLSEIL